MVRGISEEKKEKAWYSSRRNRKDIMLRKMPLRKIPVIEGRANPHLERPNLEQVKSPLGSLHLGVSELLKLQLPTH
jgi:hypothetical protein